MRFASSTLPPMRTGSLGPFFSGGGGGGGAAPTHPTTPPITPPTDPPGTPTPPTTPAILSGGGALSSILATCFGITFGATSWFATNCLTTGFTTFTCCGGGGGGGG